MSLQSALLRAAELCPQHEWTPSKELANEDQCVRCWVYRKRPPPEPLQHGTRVRLASPAPGGELMVGHTGSVAARYAKPLVTVLWDHDGKLRRVHRKRLEMETQMPETVENIADRTGGLPVPDYVELGVNTSASVACPVGTTVVEDMECAVRLPTGQLVKFWVSAELCDEENDVYQDLDTNQLRDLGIVLEPDGGAVVPRLLSAFSRTIERFTAR